MEALFPLASHKLFLWVASFVSSQYNLIVSKPERTAVSRLPEQMQRYNQEILAKKFFKAYHSSKDCEDNTLLNLL